MITRSCKLCEKMENIMILFFWLQLTVSTCKESSACMADCNSLLTPRPPSVYEQYCCIPSNSGKKFKIRESNVVRIILCPNHLPSSCQKFPLKFNCLDLLKKNVSAKSGYYTIQAPNGSLISVYCDMEGSNCDGKGGWMRVGYLNMSEPGATCPPGITLRRFNNIGHGLCGQPTTLSIVYSAQGFHYNKVCGQIKAYQFGAPDGFPPLGCSNVRPNIEDCNTYVDGVTITYGSNPRKHIWTYACGAREKSEIIIDAAQYNCPCNINSTGTTVPSFVGSNYYCESALSPGLPYKSVLYPNDPLWDGEGCEGEEAPCCTNPNMPWFMTTLNEATSEDIELRMCANERSWDEDTPLEVIDLYIR